MISAYLDCEMARAGKNDAGEVFEIGAVKMSSGERAGRFSTLAQIRSSGGIPVSIEVMTGIHEKDLDEAPDFIKAFMEFARWASDCDTIYVFGTADIPALIKSFKVTKDAIGCTPEERHLFYKTVAKMKDAQQILAADSFTSLDELADQYHVGVDPALKHRSEYDAFVLAEICEKAFLGCTSKNTKTNLSCIN